MEMLICDAANTGDPPPTSSAPLQVTANTDPRARRRPFIDGIDGDAQALEIGPLNRPMLSGPNVRYFDIAPAEALRRKLEENPRRVGGPEDVPHIDYWDRSGDLGVIPETFDVIFSAHCIEHQPDLLGHLNAVARLLEPGGRYYLIAPDKRYCFDHFRPVSTLGEVVQAALEKRRRHSVANLVDQAFYMTHNFAKRHHAGDHVAPGRTGVAGNVRQALAKLEAAAGAYVDCHAWQFTPQVMAQILSAAHALEMLDLVPALVCETAAGHIEFTAMLEKPQV